MKKFTTVAVIVALALATQVFAMGSSTKGGPTMSTNAMKSGSTMKAGTSTMTAPAHLSGTKTMTSTMPAAGMTKPQMTPETPMQPVVAK